MGPATVALAVLLGVPLAAACALVLFWLVYLVRYRAVLALPGPPVRFPYVLGHALEWVRGLNGRVAWIGECAERFGSVLRICLPGLPPIVLLTDPTDVKNLLQGTEKTNDKDQIVWRQIYPLFGSDSFFVRDGEVAMRRRKFFAALFHRHFYEEKIAVINVKTKEFVQHLARLVQEDEHRSVDMEAMASRLALDINGILSFGHDFKALHTSKYDGYFRTIWNHLVSACMPAHTQCW
jgi:cytochrome P450